jgi:hypothetical protein
MIAGQVSSEGMLGGDSRLFFVLRAGTPASWNPIKAFMQGMRNEPGYREESYPIGGRVCPRCGRFEFYLDTADLTKVNAFTAPPKAE